MGIAIYGGNRKPNLGHRHGQKGATGSQIWATGTAVYGGNRKPHIHINLDHGLGHTKGQQEAIYPGQSGPRKGVTKSYIYIVLGLAIEYNYVDISLLFILSFASIYGHARGPN